MQKIRFYDLRHQAATEMLEAGMPEGVVREIAGHVDPAMTRYYSDPRLAARRLAVEALNRAKPAAVVVGRSPSQTMSQSSLGTVEEAAKLLKRMVRPG